MEIITCHEQGCENQIDPERMQYGIDYYVLINLVKAGNENIIDPQEMIDGGLVSIFCKDCGTVVLAEAHANGYEIVARRSV